MITGTLTFEVEISLNTDEELKTLSKSIETEVKKLTGVHSCEEFDSDLYDDDEEEEEDKDNKE